MAVALHCSCILFISGHSTQRIESISFIFQKVPEERPRQKNVQQDVNKSTDSGNLSDVSNISVEASIEVEGEAHIIGNAVMEKNTSVAESKVSCDFFSFHFSIFVLPKDQNKISCLVICTTGFCIFCIPVKDQNIILCYEKYMYRHFCAKTHISLEKNSGCKPKHTYMSGFNSLI